MGSGWMIKTFERARWDEIFGAGTSVAEQKILDAMLWEEDGYFDPDAVELRPGLQREEVLASIEGQAALFLAQRLARSGLTYEGLEPPEAIRLDEFVAVIGASESLGHELEVKWHSPDFFPKGGVAELVGRSGNSRSWVSRLLMGRQPTRVPLRYLPLLQTGRRFGTEAEPTRSEWAFYVVLSPTEAVGLRDEVEAVLQADVPWRRKWLRSATEECLLVPLQEVVGTGRWVHLCCNF
jgi:hypothetical protein